jgi:hypothetical protein
VNVAGLYPDPPHLSVSVWSPAPEAATFAGVCRAVADRGGSPTGVLLTAPAGTRFEWLHELQREPEDVSSRFDELIGGADPRVEVFRAGYLRSGDLIVVERAPGPRDERHPLQATMYGDVLATPMDLWSDEDRAAAAAFSAWLLSLSSDVVAETDALYGAVQSEAELPTPSQLLAASPVYGDLFVSAALIDDDASLLGDLRMIDPRSEERRWPGGVLLADYGPLRTDGVTNPFEHSVGRSTALRLGRAVEGYLARRIFSPRV